MRVLMFGWEFPPHNSGGLGVACFGIAKALTEKNVHIAFVLPKKFPVANDFLTILFADIDDSRISMRYVDSAVMPYRYSVTGDPGLLQYHFGFSLQDEVRKYASAARAIAQRERFDIIHAHDWLSICAGMAAKEGSGKPLVVHVHATEFDRSGGLDINREVYDIEQAGFDAADKIIAVSNYTREMILSRYRVSPEKIEVVHNGHEPSGNFPKENGLLNLKKDGTKIVLFLGRITLQKGPDYFIQTAKRILDVYPKVVFLVAGSGDMEHQIVREASRLGISDKILFTGFLRGDEQTMAYQAADVFVMPSVSEPFGIVPLEALAHGTPVLVSKQSGVSEVLAHALKADFWDTEEMANKIIALLENKPLHENLSANGRTESLRQTWLSAADKIMRVYNSLL